MSEQNRGVEASRTDTMVEHCPECGGEREHEVEITVRAGETSAAVREENEEYARRPHRVYRCVYCGEIRHEQIR